MLRPGLSGYVEDTVGGIKVNLGLRPGSKIYNFQIKLILRKIKCKRIKDILFRIKNSVFQMLLESFLYILNGIQNIFE